MTTQERVKELFFYDQDTGVFVHKIKRHTKNIGDVAGGLFRGRRRIVVDGKVYWEHRLAWLYVNGSWPQGEIDHRNGIKNDNRIANLRDVTHSINMQNRRSASNGAKSQMLGVYPRPNGKFQSFIRVDGKQICLGTYQTKENAFDAYLFAKRRHHEGCTL